jgi:hypothetical protein
MGSPSIGERLLHAVADGAGVVLGFNDGKGEVGLVVENIVGTLLGAARVELAPDDDYSGGKGDFFPNLAMEVPAGGHNDSRCDILGANVGSVSDFFNLTSQIGGSALH